MEAWFLQRFRKHRGTQVLVDGAGRVLVDGEGRALVAHEVEAHYATGELLSAFDGLVPRPVIMALGDDLSAGSPEWERTTPDGVEEDAPDALFRNPDHPEGLTPRQIAALPEAEQRAFMEAWFRSHYEGPDVQTPHDPETGYIWIWGGPYDAADVLQGAFNGVVPLEVIQRLASDLTSEHWEWAPIPGPDDIERSEDDEGENAASRRVDEAEAAARREVLLRLQEVEKAVKQLAPAAPAHGGIGHNQPPEAIEGAFPLTREEQRQALGVLAGVREEAKAPAPDAERIERDAGFFRAMASKLQAWAAENTKIASNEFAKSFGSEAGKYAAQALKVFAIGAAAKMSGLVDALAAWLTHIRSPF